MRTSPLKTAIAATLAFVVGLPVFGEIIFGVLSHLLRCPPERPTCDVPDMAAFGLACVGAPLASLLVAWYAWRRLRAGAE